MNTQQFNTVKEKTDESIFGEKFSFIYCREMEKEISRKYKDIGIVKISKISAFVSKKTFIEMTNNSEVVKLLGITVHQIRDSHYNYEHINLLGHLKSDPSKKYMLIKQDDEKNNVKVLWEKYVDRNGKTYTESEVEEMMTPSALKSKRGEYGRQAKLGLTTKYHSYKWWRIVKLNIHFLRLTDYELLKYITDEIKTKIA